MTDSTITVIIMVATAVVLIGWDIYVAFFNDIPNRFDTESGILRRVGARFAGIPLAWGALGGHFWGPSWDPPGIYWLWPLGLAALAALITLGHYGLRKTSLRPPAWFATVYLVVGVPLGALMWPQ